MNWDSCTAISSLSTSLWIRTWWPRSQVLPSARTRASKQKSKLHVVSGNYRGSFEKSSRAVVSNADIRCNAQISACAQKSSRRRTFVELPRSYFPFSPPLPKLFGTPRASLPLPVLEGSKPTQQRSLNLLVFLSSLCPVDGTRGVGQFLWAGDLLRQALRCLQLRDSLVGGKVIALFWVLGWGCCSRSIGKGRRALRLQRFHWQIAHVRKFA